jgi:hypothetical protein
MNKQNESYYCFIFGEEKVKKISFLDATSPFLEDRS